MVRFRFASSRSYTPALFASLLAAGCVGNIGTPSPQADGLEPFGPPDSGAARADAGRLGARDASVDARVRADSGAPGRDGGAGPTGATYKVDKGILYDGCGEQVVLRGVNHPTIYTDRAGKAMTEIARTKANAVRLFWFANNGEKISEAEPAIEAAVQNGLLPMLELHDSTCKWELGSLVDYWTSDEAVALIERHQQHLLVNIANEASPPDGSAFKQGYIDAVKRMREAGIHVPLVIDGGSCGRNYQMLIDNGPAVLAADPDHNLIFSSHLYDPMTKDDFGALFDRVNELELPFIVGEFANREPPGCGTQLDYKSLISEAQRTDIGWLAWSWGDDDPSTDWNADCGEFDMTSTFSYDTLRSWGKEVASELDDSIESTAIRPYALTHADRCD